MKDIIKNITASINTNGGSKKEANSKGNTVKYVTISFGKNK